MEPIYHITTQVEAAAAVQAGEYKPARFDEEGFIHCSYSRQIPAVASFNFRGQKDLVLLQIDRSKLQCDVIDENLEGGQELFPHIYGPLPMAAVTRVADFSSEADGTFKFPSLDDFAKVR